ncbi:hypothetical protein [Prevotella histicola]
MTAKSEMVCNRLLFLGGERATDSYEIRLFMVKCSGTGPRKITRLDIYHRTITD